MLFSSHNFIFIFLPITFTVYFILNNINLHKLAKWHLICSSFLFYSYASIDFFPFFLGSVIFNYLFGTLLCKFSETHYIKIKKITLLLGILFNISLLGYFKYLDFFISNINYVVDKKIPLQHILLPIGISFFTFQLIAYLVDSYRNETKEYSLVNYLLFITFFPQLIVGPIVHHKEVVPQYENTDNKRLNYENISKGLFVFSVGCAKKIFLADALSAWAQEGFNDVYGMSTIDAWFSSISYTLAYYFDLSGYADMAIGLGKFFNINIPINFNSPYKARNFADYWRRWHITLSNFLGDYIFKSIFNNSPRTSIWFYLSVMITFFVSGFWHGAGWNFIVWGLINGVFVSISHMMNRANKQLPYIIAWVLTFAGIIGTRILFVSNSIADSLVVYKRMFSYKFLIFNNLSYSSNTQAIYIAIGLIIVFLPKNSIDLMNNSYKPTNRYAFYSAALLITTILFMNKPAAFLYFQF